MDNVLKINDTKLKLDSIVTEKRQVNEKRSIEKPKEAANDNKKTEIKAETKAESREIINRVMSKPIQTEISEIREPKHKIKFENKLPPLRAVMSLEKEKRELIIMITRYKSSIRFGEYLQNDMKFNFDVHQLCKLPCEELRTLLEDVRFCVANKNNQGLVNEGIINVISMTERMLHNIYKIDGLSGTLMRNEMFLDTLEEWTLENQRLVSTSPKNRLLFEVVRTAYMLHEMHSAMDKAAATKEGQEQLKKIGEEIDRASKLQAPTIEIPKKEMSSKFMDKYSNLME